MIAAMPPGEFGMSGGEIMLLTFGLLITLVLIISLVLFIRHEVRREREWTQKLAEQEPPASRPRPAELSASAGAEDAAEPPKGE